MISSAILDLSIPRKAWPKSLRWVFTGNDFIVYKGGGEVKVRRAEMIDFGRYTCEVLRELRKTHK